MGRARTRLLAVIVLALLGAPVAMHVILHDLSGHHSEHAYASIVPIGHGDHEHPIVSPLAPQVLNVTRIALPALETAAAVPVTWKQAATSERNVLSSGALRIDDDVGLQRLLSTFQI